YTLSGIRSSAVVMATPQTGQWLGRTHDSQRLPFRLLQWRPSLPLRAATVVWLGTRPAILLVGYLTLLIVGFGPDVPTPPPLHEFRSELLNLQLKWDAGWYLDVARYGYFFSPQRGVSEQQNIVFFPAYPLIIRGLAFVMGATPAGYVVGGTLASLLAFLLAL